MCCCCRSGGGGGADADADAEAAALPQLWSEQLGRFRAQNELHSCVAARAQRARRGEGSSPARREERGRRPRAERRGIAAQRGERSPPTRRKERGHRPRAENRRVAARARERRGVSSENVCLTLLARGCRVPVACQVRVRQRPQMRRAASAAVGLNHDCLSCAKWIDSAKWCRVHPSTRVSRGERGAGRVEAARSVRSCAHGGGGVSAATSRAHGGKGEGRGGYPEPRNRCQGAVALGGGLGRGRQRRGGNRPLG